MGFTIYKSTDTSAPQLKGDSGSLLAVLDSCLVNGYDVKPGAGWDKPIVNGTNYGMYKINTGSSQCAYFLNDAASGSAAEALLTGWDSITSIDNAKVTGSNQFPIVTQIPFASGSVVIRKSFTTSSVTTRPWIIFADSRSVYGFVLTGDTVVEAASTYYAFGFGEYYSLKSGSIDAARCMIMGRNAASSSAVANEGMDTLSAALTTGVVGCYSNRLYSGLGNSSFLGKHGDGVKGSTTKLVGHVPYLNSQDSGLYISPVWITDSTTGIIKGRLRGFYQFCHTGSNLNDGQIFSGSADFSGRTFQVVSHSVNSGIYFIETSDTLETSPDV